MGFIKNWNSNSLNQFLKTFKFSVAFLRLYQITLSPYLGGRCRYYPSCSNYAIEAFEKYPSSQATVLVVKRLSSCHPFVKNKTYYDPVPHSPKGTV